MTIPNIAHQTYSLLVLLFRPYSYFNNRKLSGIHEAETIELHRGSPLDATGLNKPPEIINGGCWRR